MTHARTHTHARAHTHTHAHAHASAHSLPPFRCLSQIVVKGMRAAAKVELVQALQLPTVLMAFSRENLETTFSESFALTVASLSDHIVAVLASCWSELGSPDDGSDAPVSAFASVYGSAFEHAGSPHGSTPGSVDGSPPRRRPVAALSESGAGSSRSLGRQRVEAAPLTPAQSQAQEACYAVLEQCLPLLFRVLESSNERLSSAVFEGVLAFLGLVRRD